jgi:hypothetical protein
MSTVAERVDALSVDLFEAIPSQTSIATRRSLLAVQRATARRHREFAYLEIGSYLGGSIQPYLLDARCRAIYSIDPRPVRQADDRAPGCSRPYADNTTRRMMELLGKADAAQVDKVSCFEMDASEVDPARVAMRPLVALIDGEHTVRAVLSDFAFCQKVLAVGGTVVFDDFSIVYPAVLAVCRLLKRQRRRFTSARLEGKIFAIFFDAETVRLDPLLRRCRSRRRLSLPRYRLKLWLKGLLPGSVGRFARAIRRDMELPPVSREEDSRP